MKCNPSSKVKHLCLLVIFSMILLLFIGCTNDNQTNTDNNTSTIDPDNSNSTSNDGVNNPTSDGNNNDLPSDSPTFNKSEIMINKYNYCSDFRDGYAYVAFEQNGTDYGAIIDTNGIITYKVPCDKYRIDNYWEHLGNGLFYVESSLSNST